jgi:O-antigen/teichoic acid export membrane protein
MSGVARAGAIKLAGSIVSGIFGFLFVVVLARGLGAGETGAFYEALALYLIASALTKLGADVGLIRMIPRYRSLGRIRDVRRTIVIGLIPVLLLGAVVGVVLFAMAPRIAEWVAEGRNVETVATFIRVFAPFVALNAASTVVTAGTRGFQTMIPLVVVNNIGRPILRPVLGLIAVLAGWGGVAVVLAYTGPVAAGLVAALWWLYRLVRRAEQRADRRADRGTGPETDDAKPGGELASEFWRFAAPRAFAAVFTTMVTWLSPLLLGGLRSTVDAGVYAASSRYIHLASFALTVLFLSISPQLSALLARGDRDRAEAMYKTSTAWLMLSSWPIYLTLAVFSPVALGVFGRGFQAGATALTIMSLAQLFSMAAGPANTVLLMGGYSLLNTVNTVVALTLNVGLNLLLIPRLGLEGAAIALLASVVANNLAALVELRVLMKLSPVGPGLWIVGAGTLVCYGGLGLIARWLFGPSLPTFIVFGVVASTLYLAILWRFRHDLQLTVLRTVVGSRARRRYGRSQRPRAGEGPRVGAR